MEPFFMMPEIAAAHGAEIDHSIRLVHWLMLVLFVGWSGFFVYVLVRFRRGANPRADHGGLKGHFSTYSEIAVVVVEAVLLVGFSIPLWADRMDEIPPESEAVVTRVIAEQFAWNVHYPGPDGKFGQTDIARIDLESNPLGLIREGDGADDVTTINQLHLPVDKPAIIHLGSKDVIHSFGVPHFRVKQDAIPGLSIPMWFTPTVTTEQMREKTDNDEFRYEIACAQLCGLGHSSMRGFVTIHTQQEFDTWMAEQVAELGDAGDEDSVWN